MIFLCNLWCIGARGDETDGISGVISPNVRWSRAFRDETSGKEGASWRILLTFVSSKDKSSVQSGFSPVDCVD